MYLVYGMTDRIKELMREENITTAQLAQLARCLRMPRSTVARMLAMERTPSVKFVSRAARVLGTTADWLLEGRGEKKK